VSIGAFPPPAPFLPSPDGFAFSSKASLNFNNSL